MEKKIGLLEMILFAEQEAEGIGVWETVYQNDKQALPSKMAHRRTMLRKIIATLELLKMHEQKFVELVKRGRGDRASVRRSTTRSSVTASMEDDTSEFASNAE